MLVDILSQIRSTRGSNEKKRLLKDQSNNELLKKVLRYSLDPFMVFNIVKVPRVSADDRVVIGSESTRWDLFFKTADRCASREITGNAAIVAMHSVFCSVSREEEVWMKKILKKHLAIGASTKTVNAVFPGMIPTFNVALAQKFETKRITNETEVAVEPKLDGIRCFSIVSGSTVSMYARSGKAITNFGETIAKELQKLPDGCYDGELMGEDFTALMRQAYRKDNVDVTSTYLGLFDYVPMREWTSKETKMTCKERHEALLDILCESSADLSLIQPVERDYVEANYDTIKQCHDEYVNAGFEGAMVKLVNAPYKFGRGPEVMKLKAFHDVDLKIEEVLEGTGKHAGKLGSVKVTYNGVEVQVGSGFSDTLRENIWQDKDNFIGRMIEVRYQEVTPDGSLRFPTFVCFRNDR